MTRSIEFHVSSDEAEHLSIGHLCTIHLPQIDGLFEIADIGGETVMNGQLVRKITFRSFCFIDEKPLTLADIIAGRPNDPGECMAPFFEMTCDEYNRDDQTRNWWPDEIE